MPSSAMTAPFAAFEAAINGGVQGMLSNAMASIAGGEPFGVIFDQAYEGPLSGDVDSAAPVCSGLAQHLGRLERGDVIAVAGTEYSVRQVEPDGVGWVRLQLSREVY